MNQLGTQNFEGMHVALAQLQDQEFLGRLVGHSEF